MLLSTFKLFFPYQKTVNHNFLVIITIDCLLESLLYVKFISLLCQVSYSLSVFFCGMFITVEGFNKTGIPSTLWDFMERYSKIDRVSGIAILTVVVLVMSNLASNVPTGMLMDFFHIYIYYFFFYYLFIILFFFWIFQMKLAFWTNTCL